MRRGDWAIGVVIGLIVIGAAGAYFYKSGGSKPDLVALEKFDKKPPPNAGTPRPPTPERKPIASTEKPKTMMIPPVTPPQKRPEPARPPTQVTLDKPADRNTGVSPSTQSGTSETKPTETMKTDVITSLPPPPPNPTSDTARPSQPEIAPPKPEVRTEAPKPEVRAEPPPASKPPEVVTPAGATPKPPLTHTVENDETLSGIAQRYYNSTSPAMIKAILKANP